MGRRGKARDHGRCEAEGKLIYSTRQDAKTAGKEAFPKAHPSAYPCGNHWHWGNLHAAIIAGKHTRDGVSAEIPARPASPKAAAAMRAVWAATHRPTTTA